MANPPIATSMRSVALTRLDIRSTGTTVPREQEEQSRADLRLQQRCQLDAAAAHLLFGDLQLKLKT